MPHVERGARSFLHRWRWWIERRLHTTDLARLAAMGRLTLGTASYGEPVIFDYGLDSTRLEIGHYCSLGRRATFILGGNHRIDTVTTFPLRIRLGLSGAGLDGQPWTKGDIVLGSDVWVGALATILSGVRIGNGAVVAAGAVVTKDVRPYAVVAGNPAREVRRRFQDAQCEALEAIAWWDWERAAVVKHVNQLTDTDIDRFIETWSPL